ncbi:MAG TPA: hypothetical protein EYH12_01970 [Psychromonas hadalis]|nr:hypothetical protein [Psychromonas hadalis]
MSKNKFVFLFPQPNMVEALDDIKKISDIVILDPKGWDDNQVEEIANICKKEGISAGRDYTLRVF